jgi:hypothetical protein
MTQRASRKEALPEAKIVAGLMNIERISRALRPTVLSSV